MYLNDRIIKKLYNAYGGSERKLSVKMDDHCQYLLKLPDPTRDINNNLSYINNAISEYISCNIFKSVGIPVQDTILGEYIDENSKCKIVCACKDVKAPGEELCEIANILSSINTDDSTRYSLTFDYMESIFDSMPHDIAREQISDFYYDMFIVDALIGNTDRHNGNWAIIQSDDGARISPVYDCGSSLAPLLDEEDLSIDQGAICARTANSALSYNDGKRIRYYDFFKKPLSCGIENALKRIVPKINLDEIDEIIATTEYISDKRKEFYSSFVHTSYEEILLPAFERTLLQIDTQVNLDHEYCYKIYKKVIEVLKKSATYYKQDLNFSCSTDYGYTKAGKSHIILYKNEEAVSVISTRCKDADIRDTFAKLNELGLQIDLLLKRSIANMNIF